MKNYFKKFSIMFVMSLVLVLGCSVSAFATDDGVIGTTNLNNTTDNSATVGVQLKDPEKGWKRYDDSNNRIIYDGTWLTYSGSNYYKLSTYYSTTIGSKIKFKFMGTKLRVISTKWNGGENNVNITIDGVPYSFSEYNTTSLYQYTLFEVLNLSNIQHEVVISVTTGAQITLDAIDIDDTGYLINPNESISLDNTAMNLTVNNSKQLTATTTPAESEIEWSSDNTGIVTVDENGNIKGIAVGTATITAKIKGSETKATCVVTVTDGGVIVDPPVNGDANLFIELVDGQIKSYSVSSDEIAKFKQWYLDRDNTKSYKPYYEFSKGTYKDYVIHDKIDWFQVR